MSKNKNDSNMGSTLHRESGFDIKKSKDISGEACVQSSNANVHVLLSL